MNRIRLLPEQVANQIAAGEVVERPASVVKELVENALDAQATRVTVEILAAGRGLIRVTDDGTGMSRDDALLCLERHATSKITAAADLAHIQTLGFRGEAVPSIASVSRFTLTTRERSPSSPDAPATALVIHGGKILEVREAGTPPGTTIEVRNLFYNVPARRKFLRSDDTERAHIQHVLTTIALAHPQVGFTLLQENRTTWQLPPLPHPDTAAAALHALRERLRLLLGSELQLLPLDEHSQLGPARIAPDAPDAPPDSSPPLPVRVWGWIGAPGVARASRDDQHVFVNRRPVENRGLNAALLEGYHNVLMKGRYPVACLFLELDPGEVDVNIHPAKREVKFHRERPLRQFVAQAVRNALQNWHRPTTPSLPKPAPAPAPAPSVPTTPTYQQPEFTSAPPAPRVSVPHQPTPRHSPTPPSPTLSPPASPPLSQPTSPAPPVSSPTTSPPPPLEPGTPPPLLALPLRLVGVIGRLYVVFESDRGLVLLDQHAAHERVLYEQMLHRIEQDHQAPSQRLLLPETLELSPRDASFLREHLPTLTRLGVGLSEFGPQTFLLDALPPFVKAPSPRRFALELVDELRLAGTSVNAARLGEAVIAKTVCRHAVKANDPLAGPELEALLQSLRQCAMPYTCPHGRPTLIEMNFRDLEKRFGRIQT